MRFFVKGESIDYDLGYKNPAKLIIVVDCSMAHYRLGILFPGWYLLEKASK